MEWIFLILAIVLEVSGTTSMKMSAGFTKLIPSVLMFLFYVLSLTESAVKPLASAMGI
jgi:small multidrug resistance pump